TALLLAREHKRYDIEKAIISKYKNISKDIFELIDIMTDEEVRNYLLDNEINMESVKDDKTILMLVCEKKFIKTIKFLLTYHKDKINIDYESKDKHSAFTYMAKCCDLKLASILLQLNCNSKAKFDTIITILNSI